jgi:Arc/MetJ-type ribon-helix-helix transcriptional regulator
LKAINVDIPEKLAGEIEKYIKGGWFSNEADLMREALREFIRRHQVRLMEQFMEEDIEWVLKIREASDQ